MRKAAPRSWLHSELRLAFCGVVARAAHERSLADPRPARGSVKTCGDQIPVAGEQRHLRADELSAHTISYEQSERARIVEDQCIAPTAFFPGAEQGLASLGWRRRPDVYLQRHTWHVKSRGSAHFHRGASIDGLKACYIPC